METEPPLEALNIIFANLVFLQDFGWLLLLIILLFCSGIFSGSEVALFSLDHTDIDDLRDDHSPSSNSIVFFIDHPRRLLALLLICNTFVNIAIAVVVERLLGKYASKEMFLSWAYSITNTLQISWPTPEGLGHVMYFFVAVVGATGLILLFGEVTPKIYGQLNSRKFAHWVSLPLRALDIVLRPLTYILELFTVKAERKFLERKMYGQNTSKEELDAAIDIAVSHDYESGKQADILKGIIKFNDVSASQIMTARTQMCCIDIEEPFDQIIQLVKEYGFSRYPVYKDNMDSVHGILYAKDLIKYLSEQKDFDWQQLIRKNLHYVPESRKINDILNDLQEKRLHMAFVVDEFGGISGLVTLEDIMEEIVGEIKDEFDDQHELNFSRLDHNNYLFDGKTLINDMCRVLGLDLFLFDELRGNSDSIAGLLLEQHGEMPKKDSVLRMAGHDFTVVSVSKKRIEQIKVTRK